jgi:molybdenum cofactor cytidylyltransferase
MGRPKQLLPIAGQPMLARLVDTVLAASLDEVIVVLGAGADEAAALLADRPLRIVVNPGWAEGIASSLRCGLAAVSPLSGAALFVPADLPRLRAQTIGAIVVAASSAARPIVVPTCDGRRGNPVLFARSLFPDLLGLRGDAGGRVLMASRPDDVATVDVGDPGILLDIDTPEDYAAL